MDLFTRRLQDRNAAAGAQPLITYYDERSGERTELSVQSFDNWVQKTANLLGDELLAEPGRPILLTLAAEAPAHWVTLIWVAAGWRYGCPVAVGTADDPAVEVVGPAGIVADSGADEQIACSLHPLGLGFGDALPPGMLDYGVEVRAHGDHFGGPPVRPDALAWTDPQQRLRHADVAAEVPVDDRVLVVADPATPPWAVVREALVRPVLGNGSAVIVIGGGVDRHSEIAAAERATAVPLDPPG